MAGSSPLSRFRPVLELRARILQAIRLFFEARGFLEVETPVRIAAPAPELYIDALSCGDTWLRTSPELEMKQLLAAGYERLYQIGPCFRQNEQGPRHHPEFTMLEWYRARADYRDILADTKALIAAVAEAVLGRTWLDYDGTRIELMPVWEVMTVPEAFQAFAGWNPVEHFDAERFNSDLVNKIEPNLPRGCPVILMDYPAPLAALARRKPARNATYSVAGGLADPRVAERWELYIGGIELANAFSELTCPAEQRERFEACAA
ncbi:MAG: EF-P lysine aminoacylase GenX, partial [Lentisphaerae bacterium]|nr:EF-P lysine aminoacylase GenX [Lentisphaerota bacterium]